MGFLDLFKPKLQHPNWRIRKAAIQKVTDQKVLIDVAKNDEDRFVREAAITQLTDQKVIVDIAKNDKTYSVRKAAIEKLTDKKSLADIAKNDTTYSVRNSAYKKMGKEDCQQALIDVVRNDKNKNVRKVAVEKITDQKVLVDIAKNDKAYSVHKAAIEKIIDQKVIVDIAKNDTTYSVRKAAIERLTDQKTLADIAKNDEDRFFRKAAIKKVTDQKVLVDVAKNDEDRFVREAAIEKVTGAAADTSHKGLPPTPTISRTSEDSSAVQLIEIIGERQKGKQISIPISEDDGRDFEISEQLLKSIGASDGTFENVRGKWGNNLSGHQIIVHFPTLDEFQVAHTEIEDGQVASLTKCVAIRTGDNHITMVRFGQWTFRERVQTANRCSELGGEVYIITK